MPRGAARGLLRGARFSGKTAKTSWLGNGALRRYLTSLVWQYWRLSATTGFAGRFLGGVQKTCLHQHVVVQRENHEGYRLV